MAFPQRIDIRMAATFVAQEAKMVADVTALIDATEDRVHVYPLCAACMKKALFLGRSSTEVRPGDEIVFIV